MSDEMHPFVALMRKYCIDYTNAHDQSLYDEIMEPDYVVHISGFDLVRDETYGPAVTALYERAPGLGLVVHELVLNGDRLCMRFSEHAALPGEDGQRKLACWRGIGLYNWNGRRLTENHVEQDYLALHEQRTSGVPQALEPPHLDPWMTTAVVAADGDAEKAIVSWLERGDLTDARSFEIDDSRDGSTYAPVLEPAEVTVNDLFSAGRRVAFHATVRGAYRGHLADVPDDRHGRDVALNIVGLALVDPHGAIDDLQAVTTRMGVRAQLIGTTPAW